MINSLLYFGSPDIWLRVIARVHPVHAMNAEQHQMAAELWTKATDLHHWPACRLLGNNIHSCHLLLLSPNADTHFTIPLRVEGWVDIDGWLYTQTVYLLASSHLSSSNRAQCRLLCQNQMCITEIWEKSCSTLSINQSINQSMNLYSAEAQCF